MTTTTRRAGRTAVAASAVAATLLAAALAQEIFTPPSTSGALTGLKYTQVGGAGSYNQVTAMPPGNFPVCDANPSCVTRPKQVSGACRLFLA